MAEDHHQQIYLIITGAIVWLLCIPDVDDEED
jgi:hypothetical protein